MAAIYERKSKDGTRILGWKAVIRLKGYPTPSLGVFFGRLGRVKAVFFYYSEKKFC